MANRLLLDAFDGGRWFDIGAVASTGGAHRLLIKAIVAPLSARPYATGGQDDLVVYAGSHAYRPDVLSIDSGDGDDHLAIGAADSWYVGSIRIDAGAGDDHLLIGHLEGNQSDAGGTVDGGDGNDRIDVLHNGWGIGIFANSHFALNGGAGDDRFALQGLQVNVLGSANSAVLDGGAGFDRLEWNLSYQLSHQSTMLAGTGTYADSGWALEIAARNIEALLLHADAPGQTLRPTERDVAALTAGSDFDRGLLGLDGQAGSGGTLFMRQAGAPVTVDLSDWLALGRTAWAGSEGFQVFAQGRALLVLDPVLLDADAQANAWRPAAQTLDIDQRLGGLLTSAELFGGGSGTLGFSVADYDQAAAARIHIVGDGTGLRVAGGLEAPLALHVTLSDDHGAVRALVVTLRPSLLSLAPVHTSATFTAVAGDLNGDGRIDLVGSMHNADGSFDTPSLDDIGLGMLLGKGYSPRSTMLADLDNDGDLDIVANSYTASLPGMPVAQVLANDGSGHFSAQPAFAALAVQGYGETIAIADFNNDGLGDFYLPYYFRDDPADLGGGAVAGSRLFINQGDLRFEDQTAQWPVLDSPGSLSLMGFGAMWDDVMPEGAQALDFNHDGLIDLYAASHLFLNQGGAFLDVGQALGLPLKFDEGATFFDWNNDGQLDLLIVDPNGGPLLYQYSATLQRFELQDLFPQRNYVSAFGIASGDLNGDGWDDVIVAGPSDEGAFDQYGDRPSGDRSPDGLDGENIGSTRIFLNDQGRGFTEFRSQALEGLGHYAGPLAQDLDGDGRVDLVLGGGSGSLINAGSDPAHTVLIDLLGPDGQRNQHGRMVQLHAADEASGAAVDPPEAPKVLTRIVDGGSGYMAQRDYTLQFTDDAAHHYVADAFIVDYPTGQSVRLSFGVDSGHRYSVMAADSTRSAQVIDIDSGQPVRYSLSYPVTAGDDTIQLGTASSTPLDLGDGNDTVVAWDLADDGFADRGSIGGGSGFDSLRWISEAMFDVGKFDAFDFERLVLSGGATQAVRSLDVAALTRGSDFARASLAGLAQSGSGDTLFVDHPGAPLDLRAATTPADGGTDWQFAGTARHGDASFAAFASGNELLLLGDGFTARLAGGTMTGQAAPGDGLALVVTADAVNSMGGLVLRGGTLTDKLLFSGVHAYTGEQVRLIGGDGNDLLRAATAPGQYIGALRIDGGAGDDLLEVGHVEGSRSKDSGLYGGDGNDTLHVLDTFAGVGVFGNGHFTLSGGAGADRIELSGRQFNLMADAIDTVDGGSGFDTLVWNARYDLNRGSDQTGADASGQPYAQEIGVRNIERLELGADVAANCHVWLSPADVLAITADSDFDRSQLAGLARGGIGGTLFVELGAQGHNLTLAGWTSLGAARFGGEDYAAYEYGAALVLTRGGEVDVGASARPAPGSAGEPGVDAEAFHDLGIITPHGFDDLLLMATVHALWY